MWFLAIKLLRQPFLCMPVTNVPIAGIFSPGTYPELKKNYLDTGKLKLVVKWLDFGERPQMLNALQAASCISRYRHLR